MILIPSYTEKLPVAAFLYTAGFGEFDLKLRRETIL